MKNLLIEFIPPFFLKYFLKKKKSKQISEHHLKTFSDYNSAKQYGNYEDSRIVEVVVRKTKNIIKNIDKNSPLSPQIVQNLFVLKSIHQHEPSKYFQVMEIGGACGANFFQQKSFMETYIKKWMIVETKLMCEGAISSDIADNMLEFHPELDTACKKNNYPDICVLQGALQYIENPILYLKDLFKYNFKWIYLSRLPLMLNNNESVVSLDKTLLQDHGPGKLTVEKNEIIYTPITFIPYNLLKSAFKNYQYKIFYEIDESAEYAVQKENTSIKLINKAFLFCKL